MQAGFVRIIAGKWRGLQLRVPDVKGLRPTPDRVRETLFNWLAPYIANARCLDVFAGSGVLGFEALSRGAAYVEMLDQSTEVVTLLQTELTRFKAENALVYKASAPQQLRPANQPFDIVFLDPPYQENILLTTCHYLETHGYLAASAYIYLEARETLTSENLPANWQILKAKKAGQVCYHLAQREPS